MDKRGDSIIHSYGRYSFRWTDQHLSRDDIDPLRYAYDELGASALERLREIAKSAPPADAACPKDRLDLYAVLRDHHANDETLNRFWTELHTVPDWVDWKQLGRGQKFFYRYAAANLMGFALQGFVGENSAASGVVEVLVRTGGFSTRVLLHRLLETFQFLLQITHSLESLQPGGAGHTTTIRVRLLHASVRQRIMKLAAARPDYFDVQKFGVPVNTLDSIHSISTFCCNHMWLQLPFMGVYPTQQEKEDYIALFRYVGYLLATPHEYFSSAGRARRVMESMLVHELHITPTSRIVGYNFVRCIEDLPPFNVSRGFIEAGSRVLNGDELCDALGFGAPGWYAYACFRGHCWFVMALAVLQKLSSRFDTMVVDYFRETLHHAVVNSKAGLAGGSKMDFKYVPEYGAMTGREGNGRQSPGDSFLSRPVETFYFCVFVIGCAVPFVIALGVLKLASMVSTLFL